MYRVLGAVTQAWHRQVKLLRRHNEQSDELPKGKPLGIHLQRCFRLLERRLRRRKSAL